MSQKKIKIILNFYLQIILLVFALTFGIIYAISIRQKIIEKEKNALTENIKNVSSQINYSVENKISKILFISDLIVSQANISRGYFSYSNLITDILNSDPSIRSIFIVLEEKTFIPDYRIMKYVDTLGRLNISWKKNNKNIAYIDTLNTNQNLRIFNSVRRSNSVFISNVKPEVRPNGKIATKIIAFPIFDGTNFIGIIGFSISSEFLSDIFRANELKTNYFITDEDGILLYNKTENYSIGSPFTNALDDIFAKKETQIIHNQEFLEIKKHRFFIFKTIFIEDLNVIWKVALEYKASDSFSQANLFFALIILASVILAFVINIFISLIFRRGFEFLNNLSNTIDSIYSGEIDEKVNLKAENYIEFARIENKLEDLRKRLLQLVKIHQQIEKQAFTKDLKPVSADDMLAKSINSTLAAIKERSKVRKEALENKEKNEWISNGLNLLHDASKIEENSIEKLVDNINIQIVKYTDAFISTIYITRSVDDKNILEAVSTFGLDKKRAFKHTVEFGEGVVGSVALERKRQYFAEIPEDYVVIIGGLAEMKPQSILIQPLEYENDFVGILEIAFLKKLTDYELKFFKSASTEIALSIKNIQNNIARNQLVEKMKRQTEEIEKAQKLLEAKIKELRRKEKEMTQSQADLQAMLNAVNNTLMTIEYTTSGILLTANKKYLDAMGYRLSELKGVNVLDLVKSERAELELVIKKVSNGEYYEKVMKRFTKYGEVRWLQSTYTPYFDTSGKVSKIIYFAIDITDTKKQTERLEKEVSLLKKQIKILREKI